jgi:hypothetical protein
VDDNDQEDLRKQDIRERNLANQGKGLVLAFLQSTEWDLDFQCRRFIIWWKECKLLEKYSTHSRWLLLSVGLFVSITLSSILQSMCNRRYTFTR